MKFFTREWWAKGGEDWEPFDRYEAYLASVQAGLPASLLALWNEHTLHDAEVKRIESRFAPRTVLMTLDGWDRELQNPVTYVLEFKGVAEFDQVLPLGPFVEEELGDIGYWECELLNPGVEVRILFVSGAEFRVEFEEFSFEHLARVMSNRSFDADTQRHCAASRAREHTSRGAMPLRAGQLRR